MKTFKVNDATRHDGIRLCKYLGLEPNEVQKIEFHGMYAEVTVLLRNAEGRRYLDRATGDAAKEVRLVWAWMWR